jgi:hypothetical protein
MPLILPGNVATATAATGYDVANSCRFNDGDSAYMHKTPTSAGSRRKFTFSAWIKRGQLGTSQYIFNSKNGSADQIFFNTSDKFQVGLESITGDYVTSAVFRDVSAWYHFVVAVDTEQGTAANRVRVYVNGTEVTSFSTETNPNQNTDTTMNTTEPMELGRRIANSGDFFDGYMAEVVFIDGTQYAASNFGEFDEDSPTIWKPIDVSELTFGTNGFYLDFEDSANLGNDANGGTDLTEVNLAATDQSTDTCTNNFATLNPLDNYAPAATFAEGNLQITTGASNIYSFNNSTIAVSSGKFCAEVKVITTATDNFNMIGISALSPVYHRSSPWGELGDSAYAYAYVGYDGDYRNDDSDTSYGDSYTTNDIIGIYLDLDNNKLYFSKNGTVQNSGTGISITAPASTPTGHYFFSVGNYHNNAAVYSVNFGSPAFSISSGNTDGEYGNFEYTTTITGDSASKTFKALNTKNLAEFG